MKPLPPLDDGPPTRSPQAEVYLDEVQTATVLGVAPRTVRLWRRTRGLPHMVLSAKVIRIPRSELDVWMRARMVRTVG